MKKIMIAAIAVAFTAVAQAASVTWSATKGYLYDGNGDNAAKVTSGTAYLMFVTTTFTQDDLVNAFASFEGDSGKTLEAMSSSGALANGTGTINASARVPLTDSTFGLSSDMDMYFVVFNNDKMFVSDTATAVYDALGGAAEGAFASLTATSKLAFDAANGNQGAGWYSSEAVPEPTSGLLLLLGMAGLALRRKQA